MAILIHEDVKFPLILRYSRYASFDAILLRYIHLLSATVLD